MATTYQEFIRDKSQSGQQEGFEPIWLPDGLMDFQRFAADWAIRKGRGALFFGCGTGKSFMELVWGENVVRKTNKPVMLATPIAVGQQMIKEAEKFGITAKRTRDGKWNKEPCVWITNYEQLEKYDPADFSGFIGDESSCVKDAKSERKAIVTDWTRGLKYRLLGTATAAPNDYWELGTSSEVLGYLGWRDMIGRFFKQETSKDYLGWGRAKFRFRGHAETPFWQWICSFALSMRMPSDLGFDNGPLVLPPLHEHTHIVKAAKARPGFLFSIPARDMNEERAERRHTLNERCELSAELAHKVDGPCVLWCQLNPEGDLLEKIVKDCEQVSGSMSDDEKEEKLVGFTDGSIKRLVIKPVIGAWGLNWQHCADTVVLPSHSFEQYYQLVHRFHRFGQTRPVNVHRVLSEGEEKILASLSRKQIQADRIFELIVANMGHARKIELLAYGSVQELMPEWN